MSSEAPKPPKTKYKFKGEIEDVPVLVATRTEFVLDDTQPEPTYVPKETVRRMRLKGFTVRSNSETIANALVERSEGYFVPSAKSVLTAFLEAFKTKMAANASSSGATTSSDSTQANYQTDNAKSATTPIPLASAPTSTSSQRPSEVKSAKSSESLRVGVSGTQELASRTAPVSISASATASSKATSNTRPSEYKHIDAGPQGSSTRSTTSSLQPAGFPLSPQTSTGEDVAVASVPIEAVETPDTFAPGAHASNQDKLNSKAIRMSQLQSQPKQLEDLQRERVIRTIREKAMRKLKSSRNTMALSDMVAFNEKPSPNHLEAYSQMLYEDTNTKIRAAQLILRLVQNPSTLEVVLNRQDILNGLARTLSDDYRQSSELVGIILDIFFCFSSISQLHSLLTQLEIGSKTLSVIDFEFKRYVRWMEEYEQGAGVSQSRLIPNLHRQEKLLFVCFYILLNLAEDPTVEMKLIRAGIISKLLPCLFRQNPNPEYLDSLKLLVITFLKRLSVVRDNQKALVESRLIPYCFDLVSSPKIVATPALEPIIVNGLRTVVNLAFNPMVRDYLVEPNNFGALVNTLRHPAIASTGVRVLYVLSMDLQRIIRSMDEEQDPQQSLLLSLAHSVSELLAQTPSKVVDFELASLAVNLTAYPPLAEAMIASPHFPRILKRFEDVEDVCLMKLVQNLAEYPAAKPHLAKHLYMLTGGILHSLSLDVRLAALSILANTAIPRTRYSDLLKHFPTLEEFICLNLDIGSAEDDVLLQFTMLVGTLATDPLAAERFATSPQLLSSLGDVLRRGMDIKDSEMIQQVLFTLFRLMHHAPSRDAICRNMGLLASVCESSIWPHRMIRIYANYCLNMAIEFSAKHRDAIVELRFNVTHQPYIRFIESGGLNQHWSDTHDIDQNDYPLGFDDYDDNEDEPYVPQPSQEFDIDETGLRLRGTREW